MSDKPVVIIGAGPAGLTAAYESVRQGTRTIVFESADKVGGIARTESYKDYCFDVGGHRFFTKIEKVDELWREVLGEDFLKVPRMSRIYYNGRFYNYPLRLFNALFNLGILESILIVLSYLRSQIWPQPEEETFEQWVSNRFGQRLYETFFKTYTEKVWGIPCDQIRADWAAQRIRGLSLTSAVYNALFGVKKAATLIDEFDYPSKGPGMMWRRFQEAVEEGEGRVLLNSEVIRLKHENGRIISVTYAEDGKTAEMPVEHLISSTAITTLIRMLEPKAPEEVLEAARNLTYRAFIIAVLIIDKKDLFPDQWIYIHSPNARVGRIQNFKNWSAAMVPDPDKTSVGMEYFCNEGDELWTMSEDELTDIASGELAELGLAEKEDVIDKVVLRQPKAYPVYDHDYSKHLGIIREYLETFENLQTIGRNGMHRYNNQDHSMLTGLMAAQNLSGEDHNLWTVNEEEEYLEEDKTKAKLRELIPEKDLIRAFSRMDKLGFATAIGLVSGLLFFLATIWLVIRGTIPGIPDLAFLADYFPGYTLTVDGAFIAFGYTFFWGFLFGWLFAYIRNLFIAIYLYHAKKRAELVSLRDFIDHF
ncbi:NAD(P)/FAD-dependent oxidoreductase [Desulfobacterales bacterium HSG2]|nr:NAD(P)/FAD-dependent oxidoreductase [Desulfobacterales bacterium HSG2]